MKQISSYVPLHLHTHYSLLNSCIKIDELVELAKSYEMPALAITDQGNLSGAIEFYKKSTKAGIKPIIGCEVYVAPESRHLILLAKDLRGYKNLMALVSKADREDFYKKPRIDKELLSQYSKGLIALSGSLEGEVPYYLQRNKLDKARQTASEYRDILGLGNFYIEIQENGLPKQSETNKKLIQLARDLGLDIVATPHCHYLNKEDKKAYQTLLCIKERKKIKDISQTKFSKGEFYLKSPLDMKEAFKEVPEALSNTIAIAERCNVEMKFGEIHFPKYEVKGGEDPNDFLARLANSGLEEKLGGNVSQIYRDRLKAELEVIKKTETASYFLFIWDCIESARQEGILVGPGSGSTGESLVAYCLGITETDPIKYGLLFERFLNPEKTFLPDIDMEFCTEGRDKVVSCITEKYGHNKVAKTIIFGTMSSIWALKSVRKALDIKDSEFNRINPFFIERMFMPIKRVLENNPELKEIYDSSPDAKELIDIAEKLEEILANTSIDTAGLIIAPEPITEYTPLYYSSKDDFFITQYDMYSLADIGLVKTNFMGHQALTVIAKTFNHLKERGINLSLAEIPFDDVDTYKLLITGNTIGVDQCEGLGMQKLLIQMQPEKFEDLIALITLDKPGPFKRGMDKDFIMAKHGRKKVTYEVPALKGILENTYGVILYQEQIMKIAEKLAGYTLAEADTLRSDLRKKKLESVIRQREKFIEGAKANGISADKAEKIFESMNNYAGFCFNKSHSTAYAMIAYRTAYLKANYPVEFMAATIDRYGNYLEQVLYIISECRDMDIEILPRDINQSNRYSKVTGRSIRIGFESIHGIDSKTIEYILEEREKNGKFKTLKDFCQRVEEKISDKKVLKSLYKAGVFNQLEQ